MKRSILTGSFAAIALIALILDTKTAIYAMQDALNLCITTVVPSLLPFFILTTILTANLTGLSFRFLRPIETICRMSKGTGILLITGLLGGYPAGAQMVSDAYCCGRISRGNAQRLLGFCSNAGPAFIFGILAGQFSSPYAGWFLWMVQILSCLTVGCLLTGDFRKDAVTLPRKEMTMKEAVERSGRNIAKVCLWIVVFRVILGFMERWFLWLIDPYMQVMVTGALELTLGSTQLAIIPSEGLRFVICSGMLAFGGICITMQTASSICDLGIGNYLQGKLMHCFVATVFAYILQYIWLDTSERMAFSPLAAAFMVSFFLIKQVFYGKKKKYSSKIAPLGV